jgi:exonuclease SbcD
MIKLLHAADLHLGKIFHDQSLGEDQAAMLEDLSCLLEDESYTALVIAGDVYDRSIPSPDAVDLFSSFLGRIKAKRPSLEIIVIPGNHDSASRLGFGRELFARLGIRLGVSAEDCDKPVIVKSGDERCAFFLLPFLTPGALSEKNPAGEGMMPIRSQSALAEEAARRMEKARKEFSVPGCSYSVLAAHLFASGGAETGSERVFLGAAELVNINHFKGFDYIALGHLHRCQSANGNIAGGNAWYSGSPLAYSFAEAGQEKFFLSVELGEGGTKTEKIPIKPRRKVTSLSGPFARFSCGVSQDSGSEKSDVPGDGELIAAADDYLEIRLTDRGITENARDILRRRFPHLLSLRQDEALSHLSQAVRAPVQSDEKREDGERRNVSSDFRDFLFCLYGNEMDISAELELFNSLLAEMESLEVSGEISGEASP